MAYESENRESKSPAQDAAGKSNAKETKREKKKEKDKEKEKRKEKNHVKEKSKDSGGKEEKEQTEADKNTISLASGRAKVCVVFCIHTY
jgi:hypothetical protein